MRLQEHCYLFDVILVYQKVARIARDFWGNFGAIFAKLPNCHFCSPAPEKTNYATIEERANSISSP
jgi:hypothetical protein